MKTDHKNAIHVAAAKMDRPQPGNPGVEKHDAKQAEEELRKTKLVKQPRKRFRLL